MIIDKGGLLPIAGIDNPNVFCVADKNVDAIYPYGIALAASRIAARPVEILDANGSLAFNGIELLINLASSDFGYMGGRFDRYIHKPKSSSSLVIREVSSANYSPEITTANPLTQWSQALRFKWSNTSWGDAWDLGFIVSVTVDFECASSSCDVRVHCAGGFWLSGEIGKSGNPIQGNKFRIICRGIVNTAVCGTPQFCVYLIPRSGTIVDVSRYVVSLVPYIETYPGYT